MYCYMRLITCEFVEQQKRTEFVSGDNAVINDICKTTLQWGLSVCQDVIYGFYEEVNKKC